MCFLRRDLLRDKTSITLNSRVEEVSTKAGSKDLFADCYLAQSRNVSGDDENRNIGIQGKSLSIKGFESAPAVPWGV